MLGLCGGYQMLGRHIHDPEGLEGQKGSVDGLGHLDVETTLVADKTVRETTATHQGSGKAITAYEIHLGETAGPDCIRPFATTATSPDGATSNDGRIAGTYLHGCFTSDAFRDSYLNSLSAVTGTYAFESLIDRTLDALALHIGAHLDVERLLSLAATVKKS